MEGVAVVEAETDTVLARGPEFFQSAFSGNSPVWDCLVVVVCVCATDLLVVVVALFLLVAGSVSSSLCPPLTSITSQSNESEELQARRFFLCRGARTTDRFVSD